MKKIHTNIQDVIKFLFENELNEEFYTETDQTQKLHPLSTYIVQQLLASLGYPVQNVGDIKASGAEGIVLSISPTEVVKLFFSKDNLAKSVPLLGKQFDTIPNVREFGKITLNIPLKYLKSGSSYSEKPESVPAVKEIYYMIMERIVPDPKVWDAVENEFQKIVNLAKLSNINIMVKFYDTQDPGIRTNIEQILNLFKEETKIPETVEEILTALKSGSKKQRQLEQLFSNWKKNKNKMYLMPNVSPRDALKKYLLSALKVKNFGFDGSVISPIVEEYMAKNSKALDSYNEIKNLIQDVMINNNIDWSDIHREQFGRNKEGKLVALDVGSKSEELSSSVDNYITKNISMNIPEFGLTQQKNTDSSNQPQAALTESNISIKRWQILAGIIKG